MQPRDVYLDAAVEQLGNLRASGKQLRDLEEVYRLMLAAQVAAADEDHLDRFSEDDGALN